MKETRGPGRMRAFTMTDGESVTAHQEKIATRAAYGKALAALGAERPDIVVLDADLSGSTKTAVFGAAFPDRFFNFGVAESNMMGHAAGMAIMGKTVFASSFAMFATGKAWEPIRQSICIPELDVKICASHAGVTVGEDGKSHQMLEDIALMRVLPHMTVVVPADAHQTEKAVRAIADTPGPCYLRTSRMATPAVTSEDDEFTLGRADRLVEGTDITLVACGVLVSEAVRAAGILAEAGISAAVQNHHTIKPLDGDALEDAARQTGRILTCEEHQVAGGLGSAVCETLASRFPVPIERLGMQDRFGESGPGGDLLAHFGLDAAGIAGRAAEFIERVK